MSFQPKPTVNGKYRIKVLDTPLYVEADPPSSNPGLSLKSLDSSSEYQKWNIAAVSGRADFYTITSVPTKYGMTFRKDRNTYWGYGFPYADNTPSLNWAINQRTSGNKTFSKIHLDGNSDVFDSCSRNSNAVHFYYDKSSLTSDSANQAYVFELLPDDPPPPPPPPPTGTKALDIVFLQDVTGSMQPYITAARTNIVQILNDLVSGGTVAADKLRVAVVAFRDHSPQDETLLTEYHDFKSSVSEVQATLDALRATGGGDGPEAVEDALNDALLEPGWEADARVVVLVTDAPPHGIGEPGDEIGECPKQCDPLVIAKAMARKGIVLNVLACEPELSTSYTRALDFYTGLVRRTGGRVIPLSSASLLTQALKGTLAESAALSRLATTAFPNRRLAFGALADDLHAELARAGTEVDTLQMDAYYAQHPVAAGNADLWAGGTKLKDVRGRIQHVPVNRIKTQYQGGAGPQLVLTSQPVSRAQVEQVVQMRLARFS